MNSSPVANSKTTSINIQVPTREFLAEKRILIPTCFALVALLFFFSFCDFKVVGNMGEQSYPANEQTQKSISGFNFITGTALPAGGVNSEFVSGMLGVKKEQTENLQKVSFNFWALLAFAAAIGGVYVFWKKEAKETLYAAVLAATGIVALLLLLTSVSKYEQVIDMGFVSLQTKMVLQFPYWLALIAFATAGALSFLRLKLPTHTSTVSPANVPTPIHVNIVTQEADTSSRL